MLVLNIQKEIRRFFLSLSLTQLEVYLLFTSLTIYFGTGYGITRKVIGPVRLVELIHIPKFIILAALIWGLVLTVTAPLWFDDGYSTAATMFGILWGTVNGYLILGNLVMAVIWLASLYYLPSMSGLINAFSAYNRGIGHPQINRPPSPPPHYPRILLLRSICCIYPACRQKSPKGSVLTKTCRTC